MDPTIEDRISNLESMRSYLLEEFECAECFLDDLDYVLKFIDSKIVAIRMLGRLQ